MRERVGLSQKALANMLDNTVDTVKKWENPRYRPPPEDACELLSDMLERHEDAVDAALDIIEQRTKELDSKPKEVTLLYYRLQPTMTCTDATRSITASSTRVQGRSACCCKARVMRSDTCIQRTMR
ncbi:helix-turn-helix domain-containing protein [Bifidobacterium catenulatum subsp. kashiwanohense]|uniref:Helix-turn-helix domain-containing protein n=1 Tax=Bifidobacterium catenulatum subsp. kashiwanohense TaxID=630129 RepID=A0AAJ1UPN3_9BIFI|nr:helix-turn-helix domain-containing protein [Bifidobacterium catenulatum subsp. kashiwanohense]MDH7873828.1 helix-turn-helix domain-containing protein [Bifidobacterium catenulatum subsp. kashiwanohense]MDH7883134.1 helix-turn-helix domain-containing protein [Bifidobacterium catenulatum subsp. kashiwanohense]MDH7886634.1 helix-turn-helix domain-containing protein [Bifidobacterium catenulatum subsp. kashiwanohense]MDH7888591.1 helix-turn-helix domain-containing protein [Bifidobacterium catenula